MSDDTVKTNRNMRAVQEESMIGAEDESSNLLSSRMRPFVSFRASSRDFSSCLRRKANSPVNNEVGKLCTSSPISEEQE